MKSYKWKTEYTYLLQLLIRQESAWLFVKIIGEKFILIMTNEINIHWDNCMKSEEKGRKEEKGMERKKEKKMVRKKERKKKRKKERW